MAACVPILRQEIEALRDAGADTVQLDEPWLATMVDPSFREKDGATDVQYEMDLCVDLINQTVDGIEDVKTGMHLCHAHFDHKHATEGPYDLIMPALAKLRVGTISMEYATPVASGLESWLNSLRKCGWDSGALTTATERWKLQRKWSHEWKGLCAMWKPSASHCIRTVASHRRFRTPWTWTKRI